MQPLRMIYNDLPDFLEIPKFLQHRKVEVILWPLEEPNAPSGRDNDIILSLFGSIPDFPDIEKMPFETREQFI